jgi:hypothetical protein
MISHFFLNRSANMRHHGSDKPWYIAEKKSLGDSFQRHSCAQRKKDCRVFEQFHDDKYFGNSKILKINKLQIYLNKIITNKCLFFLRNDLSDIEIHICDMPPIRENVLFGKKRCCEGGITGLPY